MSSSHDITTLSLQEQAFFAFGKKLQMAARDVIKRKLASGEYVLIDGKYYLASNAPNLAGKSIADN